MKKAHSKEKLTLNSETIRHLKDLTERELRHVQGHRNDGRFALQQLDVVRHIVLVGLEADAARLDPFRCEVETDPEGVKER